jgi:hypothetical protein
MLTVYEGAYCPDEYPLISIKQQGRYTRITSLAEPCLTSL